MAAKLSDPNTFLYNLISKKGKSELHGIYLTSVNVIADALTDYGYTKDKNAQGKLRNLIAREEHDWNRLLVEMRSDSEEIIFPISFLHELEPVTIFFVSEGVEMSCMIFIPTLCIEEFESEVVFFQHLLSEVTSFVGKTPTSLRFTIGSVFLAWDEAVERGMAKEVEHSF